MSSFNYGSDNTKSNQGSVLMNVQLQQTESNKRLEVMSLTMDALGDKVSSALLALYDSVNAVVDQNERISLNMADMNATLLLLARRIDQVEQKLDQVVTNQLNQSQLTSQHYVQANPNAFQPRPPPISPRSNSSSPEAPRAFDGHKPPMIETRVSSDGVPSSSSGSSKKKNKYKDKLTIGSLSDIPKSKSTDSMEKFVPPSSFIVPPPPTSKFMSVKWHQTGPHHLDMKKFTKEEYARQESIFELEASEEDYLADLRTCLDYYVKGIANSGLITPEEVEELFSTIKKLSEGSEKFLLTMKEKRKGSAVIDCVGEAFNILELSYPAFETYCSNHPKATKLLHLLSGREDFRNLCNNIKSELPGNKKQSLESYLIKPIQRICKYPLLFRQILQHTSPKSRDHRLLTSAMESVDKQLERINDNTPSGDEESRLLFYQSHLDSNDGFNLIGSRLVHEGKIDIVEKGELKERILLLLSDRLVILKPYKGLFGSTKFTVKKDIPSELFLVGASPFLQASNRIGFQMVWAGKDKFDISCQTEEERDKWVKLIEKCCQGKYRDGPRKISSGLNLIQSPATPATPKPLEKSKSYNAFEEVISDMPDSSLHSNQNISQPTIIQVESSSPPIVTVTQRHGSVKNKVKERRSENSLSELINEMESLQRTKETLDRKPKRVSVNTSAI